MPATHQDWDPPPQFAQYQIRRVASTDENLHRPMLGVDTQHLPRPESAVRVHSPLVPHAADTSPMLEGPEEKRLGRTASRILRLSRSFSRLGERKTSDGSGRGTPTLPSAQSRSTTPTLNTARSTPRLRSDSGQSTAGTTRMRTRTALLAARDSPDVSPTIDELGQLYQHTPSPVWHEGDGWQKPPSRPSSRLDRMRGTHASPSASPTVRLPLDLPSPTVHLDSPVEGRAAKGVSPTDTRFPKGASPSDGRPRTSPNEARMSPQDRRAALQDVRRIETPPPVPALPQTNPSGLGLTLDGQRVGPEELGEWPPMGSPSSPVDDATAGLRRSKARAFQSPWKTTKRRDKPLPSIDTPEEGQKRSNTNLRRLFKTGIVDEEEARRGAFRRRKSETRLASGGGDAPPVPPVDPSRDPSPVVSRPPIVHIPSPSPSAAEASPAIASVPLAAPATIVGGASPAPGSAVPLVLRPGGGSSVSYAPVTDPAGAAPPSLNPFRGRAESLPAIPTSDAQDPTRKRALLRQHILSELAETERTYAGDLEVVKGLYLAQARVYAGIKTPTTSMLVPSPHPQSGHTSPLPRTYSSRSTESADAKHWDHALHHPLSPKKRRDDRQSIHSLTSTEDEDGPSWAHPERTRRSPLVPERALPASPAPVAPLGVTDIHVIFAGLEPCAALASEMSSLLSAAVQHQDVQAVGSIFLQKMGQIEQVYALYCGRHEAAMARLSEVTTKNPAAAAFLAECDETSREHSRAWDLPSLLIKPVQRVLKYPLFLGSIVEQTDVREPCYPTLHAALQQIQLVADRINENKKRMEIVEQHGFVPPQAPRPSAFRRPPTALRKAKASPRPDEPPLTADEGEYRALLERVDASERHLLSFSQECATWARSVRAMYTAQLHVADAWIAVYRTGDTRGVLSAIDRLVQFRAVLQHTLLDTVCARLDTELRRTVFATVNTVHTLLERPRMVMANRTAKEHEYRKYLAEAARKPTARPSTGARAFLSLHVQLMEELPALLRGIALVMDRCVMFFAEIQTAYYALVADELRAFCTQHLPTAMTPNSASLTPTAATVRTPTEAREPPARPQRSEARPRVVRPSTPPSYPNEPAPAPSETPNEHRTRHTPTPSVVTAHTTLEPHSPIERSRWRDSMQASSMGHMSFRDARTSFSDVSRSSYSDAGSLSDLSAFPDYRFSTR